VDSHLHTLLQGRSSSRVGRLNKMAQQVVIKQLVNENKLYQDFQLKLEKKNLDSQSDHAAKNKA